VDPRAQRHLVGRMAQSLAPPRREELERWKILQLAEFSNELENLVALELMSRDEVIEWEEKMRSLLLRVKGADGREGSRPWSLTVRAEPPLDHEAQLGDPGVFLRIAPVSHAPLVTDGGGGFHVLGFELYDAQVTIVWCFTPRSGEVPPDEIREIKRQSEGLSEKERERLEGVLEFGWRWRADHIPRLSDDAGTSYSFAGGSGPGGRTDGVTGAVEVIAGRTTLRPGVPPDASELVVGWGTATIRLPLE
jgi:hypothetical protein